MIVMVLERVSTSLRGELTRWLLEARAGVFIGNVSAEVRERLWERACTGRGKGAGVLIHSAQREQGFAMQVCGEPGREIVDFEGLTLIRFPQ
jgi:CRISPR-associated protein Cas2